MLPGDRLVLGYKLLEVVRGQLHVELDTAGPLLRGDGLLESLVRYAHHHIGVHMYEPPVAVVHETGVVRLPDEPCGCYVVQTQVENGVHHAGHRYPSARPHRQQKRVTGISEHCAHVLLQSRKVRVDLLGKTLGPLVTAGVVGCAYLGSDSETGRYRNPQIHHFSQPGAFAAQKVLHVARSFSPSAAEIIHVFRYVLLCHDNPPVHCCSLLTKSTKILLYREPSFK